MAVVVDTTCKEELDRLLWTLWDPIGGPTTDGKIYKPPTDEYVTYADTLAGMFRHGAAVEDIQSYLQRVEARADGTRSWQGTARVPLGREVAPNRGYDVNDMNDVIHRSLLTWRPEVWHRERSHARLQLEFSGGPWRSRSAPVAAETADADADASFGIEVFFESLSRVVAAQAAEGFLADVWEEGATLAEFKTRINEALDLDLEASLEEAERLGSRRAPVIRALKALRRKSASPRSVFVSHVLDATLDPVTWRTASDSVGPRPSVSVLLYLSAGLPATRSGELLSDLDVALVYLGSPPAAEGIEDLTRAMTPDVPVPAPAVVLQARRNAEARTALLNDFGGLTAAQVAELSGSEARNRSALAGRWRREGRLLAVDHHGRTYYPGFQFDPDGQPRPVVAEVLEHLGGPSMTPWQQALWFTTANGWLDGRRPVDVLDDDPEAIVDAARQALREPVG
jgi:hypothetical protein